ncbi:MAG: radical SAM protein [archaeon]|nr:radical SAM protein [archaeon]MCP8319597.1 radical SAM protein [archaeon]
MINLSKLLFGNAEFEDPLRYGVKAHQRPIIVWNITRRCNLHCAHCYSDSEAKEYLGELSTKEAKAVAEDLASYEVPVVLFSGGEPLIRQDVFELAEHCRMLGLRVILSTNGTLISKNMAEKIREAGFTYVGISLDGVGGASDRLRGVKGAFRLAVEGLKNCRDEGLKTGIRFTLTKRNYFEVERIFRLAKRLKVPRVCFYHLVYVGRGSSMVEEDLSPDEKRGIMNLIISRTEEPADKGVINDVLTVDNYADAIYLYLKLKERGDERAERVYNLMKKHGGNSSGVGIADIDSQGYVHPDQFWTHYSLGNVKKRKFSEIWEDESEPLLKALRMRKLFLKGKCSRCAFLELCNGNLRVRAEVTTGDIWAPDPACYLTGKEIGVEG